MADPLPSPWAVLRLQELPPILKQSNSSWGPGDPGVPAASTVYLFLVGRGWPNVGIQSSRQLQSQVNGGPEGTGRGSSIPFGFWWGALHQPTSVCRTAFSRRKGGLCFAFQTGQDGLRKRSFSCRLPSAHSPQVTAAKETALVVQPGR